MHIHAVFCIYFHREWIFIYCIYIFNKGSAIVDKIKVSILGATGYVGAELVRGFIAHENVELVHLTSQSFAGQLFSDIYPVFRGVCDKELSNLDPAQVAKDSDLVITALPHGVSSATVPVLLENGTRVIDHSGDYRYKNVKTYEKSYKLTHNTPELLEEAVYGIPEFYRNDIKNARLVSNPGCYPTCSLMALAPFLRKGLIETDGIIIDATSGISGAGRKSDLAYSFCETDEAFMPYGVIGHRHASEIDEQCSFLDGTGKTIHCAFTPHLAPFKRGMLATIYAKPTAMFTNISTEALINEYQEAYNKEQFVRVLSDKVLPNIKAVNGTNYLELTGRYDEDTGYIKLFSAQDNLGKGAALQAIQSFNIMFGFDEGTGLRNLVRGV
jgi:N-acetyl-gamma-glutamyl-phosphate reductase